MASKAALAVVLLLAASLAGCSGGGDDGGDSSSTSSTGARITYTATLSTGSSPSATSSSSTGTSTGPASGNRAPTGSLGVAVNGTEATFSLAGSDPDGDALVWDLAFGDGNATNGTTLPATAKHSYGAPGNLTATLAITDGTDRVTYQAKVTVAPGAPMSYTFTGEAVGAHDPALTGEGAGDPIVHTFDLPREVTSLHALLTWAPAAPGTDLDLYIDDANGERGSSACANFAPVPFPLASCNRAADEEVTIALEASDSGTWSATIVPFESPNLTYTLAIDFT